MNSIPARLRGPLGVALALFGFSFLVRAIYFVLFPYPGYPDSFYYSAVARSLASGQGFSVPYLWNFIDVGSVVPAHGVLPIPSNAHWMPLASIIQVPFIWLLGPTAFASALPFAICGAFAAPRAIGQATCFGAIADGAGRATKPANVSRGGTCSVTQPISVCVSGA